MSHLPTKARKSNAYALSGAWLCHTGRMRRMNEDACVVGRTVSNGSSEASVPLSIDEEQWIVAVSDGIGGHRGGAQASHEVAESLARWTRITPTGVRDILKRLNRRLCDRGRREAECAGMGATVAGIACGAKGLFAFSVGDSRVYKYTRGRLIQVTRDDSEAEELMRHGLIPRDAGVRPGYLHALTQAVGGRSVAVEIHPHIYPLSVASSARFLVCSDGLTDMLPLPVLQATIEEQHDPIAASQLLFHLAMDAGGADNITLAVVDVERRAD